MGILDSFFNQQGGGLLGSMTIPQPPYDPQMAALYGFLQQQQLPMPQSASPVNMFGMGEQNPAIQQSRPMGQPTLEQGAGMPQLTYPGGQIVPDVPQQGAPPLTEFSAQARQPQTGPQTSGYEPGIGDRLNAGFQGFARGGALLPAIGNLIQGLTTGQRSDSQGMMLQQQRAMFGALVQRGVSPSEAMLAASSPEAFKALLPRLWPTMSAHNVGDTVGAFNPATGKFDPQFTAPKTEKLGAGEQLVRVNPGMPGAQAGTVGAPSVSTLATGGSLEDVEAAKEKGKFTGQAQAMLPTTIAKADETLQLIDQIRNHPGKKYAIGMLGKMPGLPGTQQQDFIDLFDQAKGQAFMQAYITLKGGGQITEIEGKKATDAIARLNRPQSKQGFETSLTDFETVIRSGRERAGILAGGKTSTATPSQQSAPISWGRDASGNPVRLK